MRTEPPEQPVAPGPWAGALAVGFAVLSWAFGTSGLVFIALFLVNATPLLSIDGLSSAGGSNLRSVPEALAINTLLFALWGLQHIGMARHGFKAALARVLPESLERSNYVLFTGLAAALLVFGWSPMPEVIWQIQHPAAAAALWALCASGWIFALSGILYDSYFEFNGLKQALAYARGRPFERAGFKTGFVFRLCRRPTFFGILLGCWATPLMTQGHLFFALAMTLFTLIGAYFVEQTYIRYYGDAYRREQESKPLLIPNPLLLVRGSDR